MSHRSVLCPLALLVVAGSVAAPAGATTYDLYFLGGQSNMDGYGRVEDLPEGLDGPVDGVMIFQGNTAGDSTPVDGRGVWAELRPGHGVGYASDGQTAQYSDRFGVELTFARGLRELEPEARIAVIKYSRGGTSIDRSAAGSFGCWEPDFPGGRGAGINQYDHFLATVRHATAVRDINGDGEDDTLVPRGIVWMQGESDAGYSVEIAERYEAHLARLVGLLRAALRVDDLPVVVGRISDSGLDEEEQDGKVWNHGEVVREAQASFVARDGHAALVTSTDDYGYSDRWHYDSAGYLDLGRQFATEIHGLQTLPVAAVADPDPLRFEPKIDEFTLWDGKNSPPPSPVLFVGSSSIRLWSSAVSFPGCGIVNRGFGGAQISDVQHYYERVVARYRARAILFYAGDNDVWDGKSPGRVLEDFQGFVETVRRDQPGTPVYFIAIKPSPRRFDLWRDMAETNGLVRDWTESQENLVYVDIATPMLGDDGQPRPELFIEDDLHLNEAGYEVWESVLAEPLASLCQTAESE